MAFRNGHVFFRSFTYPGTNNGWLLRWTPRHEKHTRSSKDNRKLVTQKAKGIMKGRSGQYVPDLPLALRGAHWGLGDAPGTGMRLGFWPVQLSALERGSGGSPQHVRRKGGLQSRPSPVCLSSVTRISRRGATDPYPEVLYDRITKPGVASHTAQTDAHTRKHDHEDACLPIGLSTASGPMIHLSFTSPPPGAKRSSHGAL